MVERVVLPDEAATRALGARLIRCAEVDDIFLLSGELGAGKTTLVRGALSELGWTAAVRSPTYNLLAEYVTDPPVLHADLFRIAGPFDDLGLIEATLGKVSFIEWPEALPELFEQARAIVTIEIAGPGRLAIIDWRRSPTTPA